MLSNRITPLIVQTWFWDHLLIINWCRPDKMIYLFHDKCLMLTHDKQDLGLTSVPSSMAGGSDVSSIVRLVSLNSHLSIHLCLLCPHYCTVPHCMENSFEPFYESFHYNTQVLWCEYFCYIHSDVNKVFRTSKYTLKSFEAVT